MKKLIWRSNDYCWAVYDGDTRSLIVWGQHGDDPCLALRRAGFDVEIGTLPDLDGGSPDQQI